MTVTHNTATHTGSALSYAPRSSSGYAHVPQCYVIPTLPNFLTFRFFNAGFTSQEAALGRKF